MEMETPAVSVVIPTRNRPDMVCHAVRTVLAQTYSNFEIVVVVDGPDEATVTALHSIGDDRIRVVALENNVGGAEARNVGVRNSRGHWVALLDDDDEWLPLKLEYQMKAAERRRTDKALIASRFYFRQDGIDVMGPLILPGTRPGDRAKMSEYPFESDCGFQTSVYVCNRELFLKVPFIKGLPGMQDVDWFLRLMMDPEVELIVVPEPLSIYNSPTGRPTISTGLTWEKPLEWAQKNRHLITPRAYSLFIVRTLVPRAVSEHSGFRGFRKLLQECVFGGSADLKILGLFLIRYLLPEDVRYRLRSRLLRISAGNGFSPA
jgi:glycosyltransferase involved in cell wall biosynthesis